MLKKVHWIKLKTNLMKLKKNEIFKERISISENEHGISHQLPFINYSINKFKLIPIITGILSKEKIESAANSIAELLDDETALIISTDFTHYGKEFNYTPFEIFIHDYIKYIDSEMLEAIGKKSYKDFYKKNKRVPINNMRSYRNKNTFKNSRKRKV